jgi:hypothetical protein
VCRSPAEKPCGEKSLWGFYFIKSAFEGVKLRQRVKKVVRVAWNLFVHLSFIKNWVTW